MPLLGILLSVGALFSWGMGDFLIQRSTRKVGSVKALFFISFFGAIAFLPFIFSDFVPILSDWKKVLLLILSGVITLFTALFDFEALKAGKIAIIEPINGLELPLTVGLSVLFWNERLSPLQLAIMGIVFLGIVCAATERLPRWGDKRHVLERGVIMAGIAVIGLALTNFITGVSSQETSPVFALWFENSMLTVACGVLLGLNGEWRTLKQDFKTHPKLILSMSTFDNLAWLAFACAVLFIPISIATTISEGYILVSVLLGIFVNRERIKTHQVIGIFLAVFGILLLSFLTE